MAQSQLSDKEVTKSKTTYLQEGRQSPESESQEQNSINKLDRTDECKERGP